MHQGHLRTPRHDSRSRAHLPQRHRAAAGDTSVLLLRRDTIAPMADPAVRPLSLEQTRTLRRDVLRPGHTLEEVAAREPADAYAVGVFAGDELIATGFVTRDGEPGAWRIRGMATDPAARSRGAGTAVLEALVQHATAAGAHRIWCHARTRARPFYERVGLRVVSDTYEVPESGPHYLMELRPGEAG